MTTCACTARSRTETGRRETQGKKHRGKSTEHKKRTKNKERKEQVNTRAYRGTSHIDPSEDGLAIVGLSFFLCVS